MKGDGPGSLAPDRLSTLEEILLATGRNPERVLQFCRGNGLVLELCIGLGDLAELSLEELEFLIHLTECRDQVVN